MKPNVHELARIILDGLCEVHRDLKHGRCVVQQMEQLVFLSRALERDLKRSSLDWSSLWQNEAHHVDKTAS
jgi:hypothetical protein